MMRRGTHLESRQGGGGTLLLLCAFDVGAAGYRAERQPAVPTGTTAAPAVPALPAGCRCMLAGEPLHKSGI